jgi:hypothetical protein
MISLGRIQNNHTKVIIKNIAEENILKLKKETLFHNLKLLAKQKK